MVEFDCVVLFCVCWEDDNGQVWVQCGWWVQNNNVIGFYKGGLCFYFSVNESVFKFFVFEQMFKNVLIGLLMGGGKGGVNFNFKGKSVCEIMCFCQSFMIEFYCYIGVDIDVLVGDIGVGVCEIGYMFGQYKCIINQFIGVFIGKGLEYGGLLICFEVIGYGVVYFLVEMLVIWDMDLIGKMVVILGLGNVVIYVVEKIVQLGGKVLILLDLGGFIYDFVGLMQEKIDWVKVYKIYCCGCIEEYCEVFFGVIFYVGSMFWGVFCDIVLFCVMQNELIGEDV